MSVGEGREDSIDDRRVGERNAAIGFRNAGRLQETARVLAMNPDIVTTGERVEDFLHDPRWLGLKAFYGRPYPQLVATDALWNVPPDIESQLAQHDDHSVCLAR